MKPTPENEEGKIQEVEPKTDAAKPKTESAEPKADAAKPKTDPAEPKADAAKPKTEPTEPKADTTEPAAKKEGETDDTIEKLKDSIAKVEPKKSTAEEMEDLKNVTVDTAFANSAFDTLAGISFDKLIGNPLRAAVKAQRDMAKEALSYLRDESIKVGKDGKAQLTYVTLNFLKDGKQAQMRIPLLTLIPYPSLAISSMTYKFTAKIEASSNVAVAVGCDMPSISKNDSSKAKADTKVEAKGGEKPATADTQAAKATEAASKVTGPSTDAALQAAASIQKASENKGFTAAYSSKRDSSAMRDSRYSVETTIDVTITATNQEPPVGISKIVAVLEDSAEVINSDGELQISSEQLTLTNGHAVLSANYRDGEGNYKREEITCQPLDKGAAPTPLSNGDDVLFLFSEKGTYLVKAGIFQRVVFVS